MPNKNLTLKLSWVRMVIYHSCARLHRGECLNEGGEDYPELCRDCQQDGVEDVLIRIRGLNDPFLNKG